MKNEEAHLATTIHGCVALVGEAGEMEQSISDGDVVVVRTPPGCWGPMITPSIQSGHEVSRPIRLDGATPGDSVALIIERITVLSEYAASGTGRRYPERFGKDPSFDACCPNCKTAFPPTVLCGIGEDAIRCANCNEPVIPQTINNGYTAVCDAQSGLAVTLGAAAAAEIARQTSENKVFLPEGSRQHPATILGCADIPDLIMRSRPMIGNIGCAPAFPIPSSKNSGDLIASLNQTGLYQAVAPGDITDAHMDINSVAQGSIVISPVLVEGAGVYFGDVHLTQGSGELAGHTLDVSAELQIKVCLLRGLTLEGPVIIPSARELDSRFLPFTEREIADAQRILARHGDTLNFCRYPIQVVGSGDGLDAAIECAVARASRLTGLCPDEIRNLSTVAGAVEIGRVSGTAYLTMLLPEPLLRELGLLELVLSLYSPAAKPPEIEATKGE